MSNNFPKTHAKINTQLCGKIISLGDQTSVVELTTTPDMAVDDYGLIHGGFIFGLADYAAMVAVNQPTVVLDRSDVEFRRPAKVGDILRAEAEVDKVEKENKYLVKIQVYIGVEDIFYGKFECVVLETHVLVKK
jgi:uncharacterized protein (TIGR00369 family)